jgi:hypothetical protein
MNSTPLDSSFQCASFEPKKFYLAFFLLEKFAKNTYFWLPHQQMGSLTGTFPMPEFNSKMNPYLLSNLHPEKTFKRP